MIEALRIEAKERFGVGELCAALEVSRSGFYDHTHKHRRARRREDKVLAQAVHHAFYASRQTYGTPRLRLGLRDRGHGCGRRRIARLMRVQGLRALQKRPFRPRTTDSSHGRRPAPHRLLNAPAASRPNEIWITDITYIPTGEGWLFLAAEIDLFSRRVLGWATSDTLHTSLVLAALHKAVRQTSGPLAGLIHHSDQGSQYASEDFSSALAHLAIEQSMSRRANCYDNATAESFWATLKTECFQGRLPPAPRPTPCSLITSKPFTTHFAATAHSAISPHSLSKTSSTITNLFLSAFSARLHRVHITVGKGIIIRMGNEPPRPWRQIWVTQNM